ncbi:MAG: CD225/dispanin family protein [Candidatus Nanopelagicales bacterium]
MDEHRPGAQPPNSWLVPAVLTTLCCFPLTGVVAIYFAAQVRVMWDHDDPAGALRASRRARLWTLLGFGVFLLLVVLSLATGSMFSVVDRMRE